MVFLFILLVLLIIVLTLKIKIEFKDINLTIKLGEKYKLENTYLIKLKFLLFNFFPIFTKKITKGKNVKLLKFKNLKNNYKNDMSFRNVIELIKVMNYKINNFYLDVNLGLENIMLLTMVVPIISTLIAIFLTREKVSIKKQNYKITPIYNNRKLLKY